MKTRTIAAVLLIPVLLIVAIAAPKIVAVLFVGVMAAIAAYELLYRTGLVKQMRIVVYSMIMAFAVSLWSYFGHPYLPALIGILCFYGALFGEMLAAKTKLPFSRIALCMVAGVLIPFLFSALVRILMPENGRYMILVPFAAAFLSDSGAYFAGMKFGKHKLAPIISPKKTVEGMVGGLAAATLGMLVYGLVLQLAFGFKVNYLYAVIYGLVGSLAGVFGDLNFSVIKRQTGIKDYGNLIPGHGGILDRFDSVIVVAPLMEVLLLLIPFAV